MLEIGDPAKRSCDACESFGAMCKKVIRNLCCRRNLRASFTVGFVQQCFNRVTVREGLTSGADNAAFLQRQDHVRTGTGASRRRTAPTAPRTLKPTVLEALTTATCLLEVQTAALAPG